MHIKSQLQIVNFFISKLLAWFSYPQLSDKFLDLFQIWAYGRQDHTISRYYPSSRTKRDENKITFDANPLAKSDWRILIKDE